MTSTTRNINDDEETNLKEALLSSQPDEMTGSNREKLAPGQWKEIEECFHSGPCQKGLLLLVILFANSVCLWHLVRPWVPEPNQVLPLQDGSFSLTLLQHEQEVDTEEFPMDFEIVPMNDVLATLNKNTSINGNVNVNVNRPIPPIHPHHTAWVTYSSRMGPNANVEYRRDINAPCEYGMLIFSVGPAKDDLPYTYELYNDAYLYSDNNGLCLFYPSYTGYQTSNVPLWSPSDPLQVVLKQLNTNTMHWISSRVWNPHNSKKKWDRTKVGDYAIIAKHDFYDPHFYEGLKAAINAWK